MTCKHGFPEPNEMMWQGKKILRCNECEIERLRQRVKELEDENKRLKLDVDTCSEILKISEQERIRLQKVGIAYRDRMRESIAKYKERGERMKEMRDCFTVEDWKRGRWCCEKYWFDPETGEPL